MLHLSDRTEGDEDRGGREEKDRGCILKRVESESSLRAWSRSATNNERWNEGVRHTMNDETGGGRKRRQPRNGNFE